MTVFSFFFFQAEDGIRDVAVTGVQTCALPISGFEEAAAAIAAWVHFDGCEAERGEPRRDRGEPRRQPGHPRRLDLDARPSPLPAAGVSHPQIPAYAQLAQGRFRLLDLRQTVRRDRDAVGDTARQTRPPGGR